ncbi:MAG TPA: hypothetical protein VHX39_24865 [Acetobacteraceae bacterium]|jgi:hypothetical protein|nr:hypothetical protein [Acetobacteraceae bacterium]
MKWYFLTIGSLSVLCYIPDALSFGLIFFVLPGIIMWASVTLLFYSAPGVAAYRLASSSLGINRWTAVAMALVCLAIIAVIPGIVSRHELNSFSQAALASDFSKPAAVQPRSIELPVNSAWQRPVNEKHGDWPDAKVARAKCSGLCQELLLSGIDSVITGVAIDSARDENHRLIYPTQFWRFRVEHLATCPITLSQVQIDFGADRCLTEAKVDTSDADVALAIRNGDATDRTTQVRCKPGNQIALWLTQTNSSIEVQERIDGKPETVEKRTSLTGWLTPIPFFVGTQSCAQLDVEPYFATVKVQVRTADLLEIIQRRYGIVTTASPRDVGL